MGSVLTSCSMMEEDLPPCPQGLDLYFRYDYNLQRANMFPDHVGAVDVYVYEGKISRQTAVMPTGRSSRNSRRP